MKSIHLQRASPSTQQKVPTVKTSLELFPPRFVSPSLKYRDDKSGGKEELTSEKQ